MERKPKTFRDLLASSNMELMPSDAMEVASGGLAVTPSPVDPNQSPEDSAPDASRARMPMEKTSISIESSSESPLREYFKSPDGRRKLKEADSRARQQIQALDPEPSVDLDMDMMEESPETKRMI